MILKNFIWFRQLLHVGRIITWLDTAVFDQPRLWILILFLEIWIKIEQIEIWHVPINKQTLTDFVFNYNKLNIFTFLKNRFSNIQPCAFNQSIKDIFFNWQLTLQTLLQKLPESKFHVEIKSCKNYLANAILEYPPPCKTEGECSPFESSNERREKIDSGIF